MTISHDQPTFDGPTPYHEAAPEGFVTEYAITLGIDIDAVFAAVHASNMEKAPNGVVIRREDGKVLKPEGWEPPTEAIRAILVKDGWTGDAA